MMDNIEKNDLMNKPIEAENIMELFKKLRGIDVKDKVEEKGGLSYLPWAPAFDIVLNSCPDVKYKVWMFGEAQLPYTYDPNTGYMVWTEVTINSVTRQMWLPVMDYNNKPMLSEPYTYEVDEWANGKKTGNKIEKRVEACTMSDINKSIMRCLVKNLAMFGLGLNLYLGEDLPDVPSKKKTNFQEKLKNKEPLPENPLDWAEFLKKQKQPTLYYRDIKASNAPWDVKKQCNDIMYPVKGKKQEPKEPEPIDDHIPDFSKGGSSENY